MGPDNLKLDFTDANLFHKSPGDIDDCDDMIHEPEIIMSPGRKFQMNLKGIQENIIIERFFKAR